MNPNVVFFGPADYGKSTVIGYLYAESEHIDMNKVEKNLKDRLGTEYQPDFLYSSLINPEHASEGLSRFSSRLMKLKRIIDFTFIDTPGHDKYMTQREQGILLGKIGVLCLAINEVLQGKHKSAIEEFTDLWFEHYVNRKLICLLTKFDVVNYNCDVYHEACKKVKACCQSVYSTISEDVFGIPISFDVEEPGISTFVPVAVDFRQRIGVNIIQTSEKTPWYNGPTLVDAIKERAEAITNE